MTNEVPAKPLLSAASVLFYYAWALFSCAEFIQAMNFFQKLRDQQWSSSLQKQSWVFELLFHLIFFKH